ncbi:LAFE_0C09868g1_1 [Lachancea fermentati]|uniref:Stationary phase protein 4 n=1 Tax=Lachancea fermentati TaxID=4955 RepID=A0A1G4M9Z5_LACFM|nr:LAFE_0C09868g1_1 [Lachancea fermentati]
MPGFFEAFEVYNRKKHSSNPSMFGSNHSNIGGNNTGYMFAHEYREPKKEKLATEAMMAPKDEGSTSRKSSVSSTEEALEQMPRMVDVSKMSQAEFESIFRTLHKEEQRKGEPNNRVNF